MTAYSVTFTTNRWKRRTANRRVSCVAALSDAQAASVIRCLRGLGERGVVRQWDVAIAMEPVVVGADGHPVPPTTEVVTADRLYDLMAAVFGRG